MKRTQSFELQREVTVMYICYCFVKIYYPFTTYAEQPAHIHRKNILNDLVVCKRNAAGLEIKNEVQLFLTTKNKKLSC